MSVCVSLLAFSSFKFYINTALLTIATVAKQLSRKYILIRLDHKSDWSEGVDQAVPAVINTFEFYFFT